MTTMQTEISTFTERFNAAVHEAMPDVKFATETINSNTACTVFEDEEGKRTVQLNFIQKDAEIFVSIEAADALSRYVTNMLKTLKDESENIIITGRTLQFDENDPVALDEFVDALDLAVR